MTLKTGIFSCFFFEKAPFLTTKPGFESLIVHQNKIIRTVFVGFTPVNGSDYFFLSTILNKRNQRLRTRIYHDEYTVAVYLYQNYLKEKHFNSTLAKRLKYPVRPSVYIPRP